MGYQGIDLVMRLVVFGAGGADIATVLVIPLRGIVVHHDVWVVDNSPSPPPYRPRCFELDTDLCTLASQMRVKRLERGGAERHIDPFDIIDVLEVGLEVMVPDAASPPRDSSDPASLSVFHALTAVNHISAANRTDGRIGGEAAGYS
jgi:hypothetical protein